MKLNALKKRTLRLEQLENRELLSATTWDNAFQADAAVAAEMAATLSETPIDLSTILVNTNGDVTDANDGLTTLREAIAAAQAGDTIVFADGVTEIVLAQDWWENALVLDKAITIDGGDGVTIDASGSQGGYGSSVFQITGGTEDAPVKLAGLTITGGDAGNGGGIYVDGGYALVEDSAITGNTAGNGGAVYVNAGSVAFVNVEISNNTATTNFSAVGLNHLNASTASFDTCLIVENEAAERGAIGGLGAFSSKATIEVANTTITANESAKGAALYAGSSTVAIENSIIAENTTAGVVTSSSDVSGTGTITATNVLSGWTGADIEYDATKPLFEDAAAGDYTLADDSQALGQGEGGSDLGAFKVSNETPSLVVTVSTDVVDPTDGKISLREALAYMANDATLGKSITFDASLDGATIYLTQGELEFTNLTTGNEYNFRGLKIDASALANGITVDAQGESRVFNVFRTSKMDSFRATFNNLTIANGYAEGNGGGIYSALDVVLVDCDLIDNQATGSGAGVYSAGATVSGSYFKGNLAWGGSGGGLYFTGSNMSITDSTFEENGSAAGSGGGIYATGSNNTFDSLTFVGNVALNNGGGLALDGAGKQKQATNLTFENNLAFSGNGGGLYFAGSNTTFDGLTLVGNEAGANGGGFYGAATLTNSTVTDNFATVDGGGIYSTGGNISKTLIADNEADGVGGGLRLYGAGSKLTNVTIAGNAAEDGAGVYSQAYNAYYDSIILGNIDWDGVENDIAHYGAYRSVGYNVISTHDNWDAEPIWGSKLPSENMLLYYGDGTYSDVFEDAANGDYSLSYNSLAFLGDLTLGAFEYDYDLPSLVVTIATDVVDPTDGEISLREALAYLANDATLGSAITFDASLDGATILLTEGELEFTSAASEYRNLKIDASALENGITIDAQSASRVFNIFKTTGNFRPTFVNLTIANGCVDGDGAGIYSSLGVAYALTLTDCVVANNVATGSGGGVYSLGATVAGSVFMSNQAGVDGGGLYFAGSNMSITDSAFASNVAGGSGGGIYATGSNNTFDSLTFVENAALNNGGGLALDGAGKQKQATNLTFENNLAFLGDGGGLYFAGSNTTFDGLTLVGNSAANGGGFYGAATLTNSTITGNYAEVDGGGIYSTGGNISKTLIADNEAHGFGGGLRLYGAGSKLTNVTIAGNTAEDGAGVYSQAYNAYYDSIVLANVDKGGYASDIAHHGSYRSVGYNVVSTYDDWDAEPIWGSKLPSENVLYYVATSDAPDYSDVFEDAANGDYSLSFNSLAFHDGVAFGAFEYGYETPSLVVTIATDVVDPTDGEISLREAILYAAAGETVTFAEGIEEIVLDGTQLEISKAITIDGGTGVTIDANGKSRVVYVARGTEGVVSFKGLTFVGGNAEGAGGGLYLDSFASLENCVVKNNYAGTMGGGIYIYADVSDAARATDISNTLIVDNVAGAYGGGVSIGDLEQYGAASAYKANLTNVTIAGNSATDFAGGLFKWAANATISDSIIVGNAITGEYADEIPASGHDVDGAANSKFPMNAENVLSRFEKWSDASANFLYNPAKPLFTDAENGDYSLAVGSQALGKGQDGADLGAFESPYEIPSLVVTIATDVVDPTDGEISLREAILYAAAGETVTFADGVANVKLDAQIVLDKAITVDGGKDVTLDAQGKGRIFSVEADGVNLSGLTFVNGDATVYETGNNADIQGGAIRIHGDATLTDVEFRNNIAAYGGAFSVRGASATVTNLVATDNKSTADGSAIYLMGQESSATVTNALVVRNTAGYNNAGAGAAAINSFGGAITLNNATIADNVVTANDPNGPQYIGAAGVLGSFLSPITLNNSIVVGNVGADGVVRDVELGGFIPTINANNTLSSFVDWSNASTATNYVYDATKPLFTDAANGDYTLAVGSQAIGRGDSSYVSTTTDLAGADRVRFELVDLGAFESAYGVLLAAPTVSAEATSATTIKLTFGEIANATGYAYQISTVDGAWSDDAWIEAQLDENGAITVSGLDSNTTYYVVAKALGTESGSYVDSNASDSASATTILSTPQNLGFNQYKRSNADGTRVYLLWDRIDDVVSYRVEYRELGTDEWVFIADYPQDLNILVQGQILYDYTPGVTYEFRVRAENENSVSEWANSTFTTLVAPAVEVASIDGVAKTATLSFVAPENAAKYRVEILDRPFPTQAAIPYGELTYCVSFGSSVETWTCKNLQPGTTYYCRVYAANATNTCVSDWTEFEFTLMDAPTDVVFAVDETDGTGAVVSWTGVDATATEYAVETSRDGVVWSVAGTTTGTTFELADWAGEDCYVRVQAQNGVSASAWTLGAILAAPANATSEQTKLVADDGTQVRVKWNDVSDVATRYRVEYREADSDEWTLAGVRGRGTQIQSIYDLVPSKAYEFRVRAENQYGVSAWSTTSLTALAAPAVEVTAVDVAAKRATIVLAADPNATHMRVEVSTTPFTTEAKVASANLFRAVTLTANTQKFVLGNLDANATYYVRVMSIGETGCSDWADVETFSCLPAPSDVAFVADEADATRGVVSWTDNGDGETEFLVEKSTDGQTWELVATTTETSVELTNLAAGEELYLRVRSQNEHAVSIWARGGMLNAPANVAGAQAKLLDAAGTQLRVLWTDNSDIATQYRVEYREAGSDEWTFVGVRGCGSQAQTINDFTPGVTYEVRVRAENKYGVSEWATSTVTPMAAPTVELVSVDAAALTLSLASDALATNMRVEISTTPFETESKIAAANLFRAATIGGGEQTRSFGNLEAGATYYVRVLAINADGVSAWSEVLEVVVPSVDTVSEAFADLFAEDGEDDFWFEFEKATGARK